MHLHPSTIYWLKFAGISFAIQWLTAFIFMITVLWNQNSDSTGGDIAVVVTFLLWIINILLVLSSLVAVIWSL